MTRYLDDDEPTMSLAQPQWTLADIYDDLGAMSDVCKVLNVSTDRFRKWVERRERIKCPMPIRRIAHIDIYSIIEWQAWFEKWQTKNKRVSENNKWVDTRPHGANKPFFTFEG